MDPPEISRLSLAAGNETPEPVRVVADGPRVALRDQLSIGLPVDATILTTRNGKYLVARLALKAISESPVPASTPPPRWNQ